MDGDRIQSFIQVIANDSYKSPGTWIGPKQRKVLLENIMDSPSRGFALGPMVWLDSERGRYIIRKIEQDSVARSKMVSMQWHSITIIANKD